MTDYLTPRQNPYLPDLPDVSSIAALLQSDAPANPPGALYAQASAPASSTGSGSSTLALLSALQGSKSQGGSSGRRKAKNGGGGPKSHNVGIKGLPDSMGNSPGQNRRIAQAVIDRKYPSAWDHGRQWNALNRVVGMESGWDAKANNPTSTAYGIAQRLMSSHPITGPGDNYMHSPIDQVEWMLKYIKGRYGSPVGALHHEQSAGWY